MVITGMNKRNFEEGIAPAIILSLLFVGLIGIWKYEDVPLFTQWEYPSASRTCIVDYAQVTSSLMPTERCLSREEAKNLIND